MPQIVPAENGELMSMRSNGQDWLVAWHPGPEPPPGNPHGAAGVCVTEAGQLVLISHDGLHWGFPAGRPEGNETVEDTLRREMLEEACSVVRSARLLGYSRGECVNGQQRGLVLVRSYWRADVEVLPWEPRFEIRHRRLVDEANAVAQVRDPDEAATRISHRALQHAGVT